MFIFLWEIPNGFRFNNVRVGLEIDRGNRVDGRRRINNRATENQLAFWALDFPGNFTTRYFQPFLAFRAFQSDEFILKFEIL